MRTATLPSVRYAMHGNRRQATHPKKTQRALRRTTPRSQAMLLRISSPTRLRRTPRSTRLSCALGRPSKRAATAGTNREFVWPEHGVLGERAQTRAYARRVRAAPAEAAACGRAAHNANGARAVVRPARGPQRRRAAMVERSHEHATTVRGQASARARAKGARRTPCKRVQAARTRATQNANGEHACPRRAQASDGSAEATRTGAVAGLIAPHVRQDSDAIRLHTRASWPAAAPP
jgi:hypothetical protein